ncbi:Fcf2-domain-containing protein [Punctularia strigosozonata HHB-11173 SS5]|uniref:Fcf2-domain-containing protein n=1 Tax=Punctularia strigosozonata (strain HHB-11173) TaxID=741275 RepID=UPI0004416F59|nr:Fcf2-domain-containing protein [Punctularia strigosozonata HHB-11173 SS5]EIN12367.1 Fcf2-domain-containing protein [Punctularia strigosozonata HHB-11173 SS5]
MPSPPAAGPSSPPPRKLKAPSAPSGGYSSSSSVSSSESDSASSSDEESTTSESDEEINPEYLDSLLERARRNVQARKASSTVEEDVIRLEGVDGIATDAVLPALDPGPLPPPYITTESDNNTENTIKKQRRRRRTDGASAKVADPEATRTENAAAAIASYFQGAPAPPLPPPELDPKTGRALTKKERKALKADTAGASWFDLPAPPAAELPRLYREVEALRLRNHLDPKRFYRKEEGEGKGIKGLPKYFAIGTVVAERSPFDTASPSNLTRAARKRTLVDELVDDAEAKSYAKKKFKELQTVRGARGKGTLRAKNALRKKKW